MIDNTINDRLYTYIGGIIRELGGTLIEINAMPEHIHFYAYMPKTVSVSKFMEIVKANSSNGGMHLTAPGSTCSISGIWKSTSEHFRLGQVWSSAYPHFLKMDSYYLSGKK